MIIRNSNCKSSASVQIAGAWQGAQEFKEQPLKASFGLKNLHLSQKVILLKIKRKVRSDPNHLLPIT